MEEFNLEKQYQSYLQRVALKESEMHPEQKKQVRQAFMGACGQMLVLLRDEISKLSEEEAIDKFQDMMNQVGDYFLSLGHRQN
jgi:hypothetical protein